MNEVLFMGLSFIAGLLLGAIFFGGLWYTVGKLSTSPSPGLWFIGSFFMRSAITVLGFYYISLGDWRRLLVCLAGFIVARYAVVHFTKSKDKLLQTQKENNHEA
jgi:F1F0 ATPase subunit 2